MRLFVVPLILALILAPSAQSDRHEAFDRILDTYVRDGYVYYLALQKERAPLDRYIGTLDVPETQLAGWPADEQAAFWINAYNALVLRTVINAYPIKGKSPDYPVASVRQIPGGFDKAKHRVAGRLLTLDEIERELVAKTGDARTLLALGRGSVGGGRLRSEVYRADSLDRHLTGAVKEFVARVACVKVDSAANLLEVTPLFSWREDAFVASFAGKGEMWKDRSPLERAVAALAYPHLYQSEREFLALNAFRMQFGKYDWRLNDLTGGTPR